MYTTTLARLRKAGACIDGYNRLAYYLKGEPYQERSTYLRFKHTAPIALTTILESNGLDDALWALRATAELCDRDARLFAVACVREVEHLLTDERSRNALLVAERFANGLASRQELDAARAPVIVAREATQDAADAAWAAGGAVAGITVQAVARGAAAASAESEAWAAAEEEAAGPAAWVTTGAAAWDVALAAAQVKQQDLFIAMCNGTAPWQQE